MRINKGHVVDITDWTFGGQTLANVVYGYKLKWTEN